MVIDIHREDDGDFIGEPIVPARGEFDTSAMARGEPAAPARFVWRQTEYTVLAVLKRWKTTGPCSCGADEQYVRKHWFRVRVDTGETMTLYCRRQPAGRGADPKARWILYSAAPSARR